MTNEYMIGLQGVARMAWAGVFSTLYMLGGRKHKWIRRYLGGILFPAGIMAWSLHIHTFRYIMLGALVTYPLVLSMGYGGNSLIRRIGRRVAYGLLFGVAGFPFVLGNPAMLDLFGFQVGLSLVASVYFGLRNPLPAANEEFNIAFLSTLLVPFYV